MSLASASVVAASEPEPTDETMADLGVGEAAHLHGGNSATSFPTSANIQGADALDTAGSVAHASSTHSYSDEARRRRSAAKNKNRKAKEQQNIAK